MANRDALRKDHVKASAVWWNCRTADSAIRIPGGDGDITFRNFDHASDHHQTDSFAVRGYINIHILDFLMNLPPELAGVRNANPRPPRRDSPVQPPLRTTHHQLNHTGSMPLRNEPAAKDPWATTPGASPNTTPAIRTRIAEKLTT